MSERFSFTAELIDAHQMQTYVNYIIKWARGIDLHLLDDGDDIDAVESQLKELENY